MKRTIPILLSLLLFVLLSQAAGATEERVYVANAGSNSVSVVDGRRLTVIATVTVGKEPHNVVATPDGRHVYVTNYGEDTVSVIDGERLRENMKIRVGLHPDGSSMFRMRVQGRYPSLRLAGTLGRPPYLSGPDRLGAGSRPTVEGAISPTTGQTA
ncbi:MAG: YncE family protein [Deltaproteobacteria bacterium]|nr:YncE family protein [Deltaproteobacteria bacterium]